MLRAIALGLNGPNQAAALRIDLKTWLRSGVDEGQISIYANAHSDWDIPADGEPRIEDEWLTATLSLVRSNGFVIALQERDGRELQHMWGNGDGWFAVSYGPFRRFQGGDQDLEKLYHSYPKIARHLTLFGENVALSECTEWLRNLKFRELENQRAGDAEGGAEGKLLRELMAFVNDSQLLPHDFRLSEVRADGVIFVDADGTAISVDELSDGYRSVLSMTFEPCCYCESSIGAQVDHVRSKTLYPDRHPTRARSSKPWLGGPSGRVAALTASDGLARDEAPTLAARRAARVVRSRSRSARLVTRRDHGKIENATPNTPKHISSSVSSPRYTSTGASSPCSARAFTT